MRLSRNQAKYAAKRRRRWPKRYGTDGPQCPYCCRLNGKFKRETERGREALREMTSSQHMP